MKQRPDRKEIDLRILRKNDGALCALVRRRNVSRSGLSGPRVWNGAPGCLECVVLAADNKCRLGDQRADDLQLEGVEVPPGYFDSWSLCGIAARVHAGNGRTGDRDVGMRILD